MEASVAGPQELHLGCHLGEVREALGVGNLVYRILAEFLNSQTQYRRLRYQILERLEKQRFLSVYLKLWLVVCAPRPIVASFLVLIALLCYPVSKE